MRAVRLAILLLALIALGAARCEQPAPAETVFVYGNVVTMDDARPRASAVALREGAIVFVGNDAAARAYIGEHTTVVDLAGRTVLPGFHDTHAHVLAGGSSLADCNLQDARNADRIRMQLDDCLATQRYADDEWVIGARWALAAFADGNPRKEWLDAVFGMRPAYFVDSFGHSAWVSSRALAIAGIGADTPDPPQGVIERDPQSGEATGTLRDAAMELVARHIPPASDADIVAGIRRGQSAANRVGITAYVEPGLDARQARHYRDLDGAGELTARVVGSLSPLNWQAGQIRDDLLAWVAEHGRYRGARFRTDSVKIYIDGVIETRTSHMLEPYADGSNFAPFYARDRLFDLYRGLHDAGLQIHTHAIGDGAIRLALDAYEHARQAVGPLDNRHHIVHLQLIDETDIPRFAELGVAASFQGLWAYRDDYIDVAVPLLGAERVERFYPVASVQRAGGLVVGGSDWDVSSLNPLDAIETLVRREDPFANDGRVLGDDEQLDLDTALRAYTSNAAHLMRLEQTSGSISVGKRADLIVLDRDPYAVPITEINDARVLLTLIDGREVFRDGTY